jgi:hypothetical protein
LRHIAAVCDIQHSLRDSVQAPTSADLNSRFRNRLCCRSIQKQPQISRIESVKSVASRLRSQAIAGRTASASGASCAQVISQSPDSTQQRFVGVPLHVQ